MTHKKRLEELYDAALKSRDVCLALDIADRMAALPSAITSLDPRIQAVTDALDERIHQKENDNEHWEAPYHFEYGGHTFKVEFQ